MSPELLTALVAAVGGILGGGLLTEIARRTIISEDDRSAFRKELREEVSALRTRIDYLQTQLDTCLAERDQRTDEWRTKYYVAQERLASARGDYQRLQLELDIVYRRAVERGVDYSDLIFTRRINSDEQLGQD